MLKYYVLNCVLYHGKEKVFHRVDPCIIEEFDNDEDKNQIKRKTIEFTWDNLDMLHEEYEKYDGLCVKQNKKGKMITCAYLCAYKDLKLKEWRQKNLNLKLEISRAKIENPPIKDILEYYDGDVALRYLKERL